MLVIHSRSAIHILLVADCVLEFPCGNEIGHLIGVFLRAEVFFPALSVSYLTLPKPENVFDGVLKFLHLLRDKSKKDCGGGILQRPCGHYYAITHFHILILP